jgi:hypothetical protein
MGVLRGVGVPRGYWKLTLQHWLDEQKPDGGWGYNHSVAPDSTMAMTVAGLASLYVCADNLYAARFVRCGGNREMPAVEKGLSYVEKHFAEALEPKRRNWIHYTLYGVERVALASGMKFFGKHDWYREGGLKLLSVQSKSGAWERPSTFGPLVSTSYSLLFLTRGQNPVLVNKLKFKGDWNNRPRDAANLTRWVGQQFEATLNWQVIDIDLPVKEWHDAPILYISAEKAVTFDDSQITRLREYVQQGGTIFSLAECDGREFSKSIREVYAKMLPDYELADVPEDHPFYDVHFKIRRGPALQMISNGLRPLVIHCDEDLAKSWQLKAHRVKTQDFEIGANIAMFLTDKQFRHRGTSNWPRKPGGKPTRQIKVVRLRYANHWNPEPLALERLSRLMQAETGVALEQVDPIAITDLGDSDASVAFLTGTDKAVLTDEERKALKAYVDGGGTVVVDAAGGAGGPAEAFAESMRPLLEGVFAPARLDPLPVDSPVYRLKDYEISEVAYRRPTGRRLGGKRAANLKGIVLPDGRVAVVFSGEDITAALLGQNTFGLDGYLPDSAYALMRNVILSAAPAKQAEKAAK